MGSDVLVVEEKQYELMSQWIMLECCLIICFVMMKVFFGEFEDCNIFNLLVYQCCELGEIRLRLVSQWKIFDYNCFENGIFFVFIYCS